MKKLKQGDLCKIWINNDSMYWGILDTLDGDYINFRALYQNRWLERDFRVHPLSVNRKYNKITVWKPSSFNRMIIPFGLVVRNGEFVNASILVKELSGILTKYLATYACYNLYDHLQK